MEEIKVRRRVKQRGKIRKMMLKRLIQSRNYQVRSIRLLKIEMVLEYIMKAYISRNLKVKMQRSIV
jgi:hypothetical protein